MYKAIFLGLIVAGAAFFVLYDMLDEESIKNEASQLHPQNIPADPGIVTDRKGTQGMQRSEEGSSVIEQTQTKCAADKTLSDVPHDVSVKASSTVNVKKKRPEFIEDPPIIDGHFAPPPEY